MSMDRRGTVKQEEVMAALRKRVLAAMTQAELAARMGRSRNWASQLLRGKSEHLWWEVLTAVLAEVGEAELAFVASLYGGLPAAIGGHSRAKAAESEVRELLAAVVADERVSLAQLARRTGWAKSHCHQILRGPTPLSWRHITAILAAVNLPEPDFWAALYAGSAAARPGSGRSLSERVTLLEHEVALLRRLVERDLAGPGGRLHEARLADIAQQLGAAPRRGNDDSSGS